MNELTTREPDTLTISKSAKRYVQNTLADSTLRGYKTAWREFEHFAESRDEPALPASPATVIEYLAALADSRAKMNTIRVKLAAIAWAHRIAGIDPPPTAAQAVKSTMKGIARTVGVAPSKKEPATLEELKAMIAGLPDTLRGKRNKALLLVGFAGAFRRSELVALDVEDIRLNGDLKIIVRRSKTDQEGKGQVKRLTELSDASVCPVRALRDWLDASGIRSGPVFRWVDKHGNVWARRLGAQSVALVVKDAAKAAGLDWRSFSGHSLRSGFVTDAMNAGASDSDIMEQTGHESSETMRSYRKSTGVGALRAVRAVFGETAGS